MKYTPYWNIQSIIQERVNLEAEMTEEEPDHQIYLEDLKGTHKRGFFRKVGKLLANLLP